MPADSAIITHERQGDTLVVRIGGAWRMGVALPEDTALQAALALAAVQKIRLEPDNLAFWDSTLLIFLVRIIQTARTRQVPVESTALPEGVQRLLHMAFAVPPKEGSARTKQDVPFLEAVGEHALRIPHMIGTTALFASEIAGSLGRLLRGKTDMRMQDVYAAMRECGMDALPIISITSMLFGLILAFVGAIQLTQFGAQIYVAGLVGIGMLRVMGAVMVGVVMSGRMGAAYAALIGTMQVNEEVDALATFGISPVDFLVLPRIIALTAMTPILTLFADVMGVFGGFLVGIFLLGLHPLEYINATINMVPFKHVLIGLVYGTVFGLIVAFSGCYQGIRCGRSAAAVGQATTAAVVNAIVGIIVATAIITIICNVLKV